MPAVRHRKPPKSHQRSQNDEDISKLARTRQIINNFIRVLRLYKRRIALAAIVSAVIVFLHHPPPDLSRHAKHWRDSGYLMSYQSHNVFYRDIIRLEPPITLSPVLLILHGFPASSYDWKNLVPGLQLRIPRVVVPDLLGYGFSDKPRGSGGGGGGGFGYTIGEQASLVEHLLTSLNITEVHILAHDYGDSVAQELVARSLPSTTTTPSLKFSIKSVCLTNGGIVPSSHQPVLLQKLMVVPVVGSLLARTLNWFVFRSRFAAFSTPPGEDHLYEMWSILRHNDGHLVVPSLLKHNTERATHEDRWVGGLQQTDIPLHLIYGAKDLVNTLDVFLPAYKTLVPKSGISIVENAGQHPHVEDSKSFLIFYGEFLDVRVGRDHKYEV